MGTSHARTHAVAHTHAIAAETPHILLVAGVHAAAALPDAPGRLLLRGWHCHKRHWQP